MIRAIGRFIGQTILYTCAVALIDKYGRRAWEWLMGDV